VSTAAKLMRSLGRKATEAGDIREGTCTRPLPADVGTFAQALAPARSKLEPNADANLESEPTQP
jgi:hypothetical protein